MKKTLAAVVLAVVTLSASGCGGNDDATASRSAAATTGSTSGSDAKASASIADSLMKQQQPAAGSSQFFTLRRRDADCIGKGLVSTIGTHRLQEYGLLTRDLRAKDSVENVTMSSKDAASATDTLFGCADVAAMMRTAINRSGNLPAAMRGCVGRALTEEHLRPMFQQVFQGDSAAAQRRLATPLMKCAVAARAGAGASRGAGKGAGKG